MRAEAAEIAEAPDGLGAARAASSSVARARASCCRRRPETRACRPALDRFESARSSTWGSRGPNSGRRPRSPSTCGTHRTRAGTDAAFRRSVSPIRAAFFFDQNRKNVSTPLLVTMRPRRALQLRRLFVRQRIAGCSLPRSSYARVHVSPRRPMRNSEKHFQAAVVRSRRPPDDPSRNLVRPSAEATPASPRAQSQSP